MDIVGTWDAAIAAAFSGGITAAIAKAYIAKIVENSEKMLERVSQIDNRLARIEVKVEHCDETASIVSKHDRKIAALEAKVFTGRKLSRSDSCDL